MSECRITVRAMSEIIPESPSRQWQETVRALGHLDGAEDTADRLLLHLHYAIDWKKSWVRNYLKTYWDSILPTRVRLAAYQADSLPGWWSYAANDLVATPQSEARRLEVATLLNVTNGPAVLTVFHDNLPALVMRTQIFAEAVRKQRNTHREQSA